MSIKEKLLKHCQMLLNQRIQNAEQAMASANESMLSETKSSAGDKFETGRAMMQGEQDRMKAMIIKNKEMAYQLSKVSLSKTTHIGLGSLVKTNQGCYFIAVGLGKVELENKTYYTISLASPLGQMLQGKIKDDSILLNGRTIKIHEVN